VVRALSIGDYEEAAASTRQVEGAPFDATAFQSALTPFLDAHGRVVFDGRAKQGWNTVITPDGNHRWTIRQVLVGPFDADDEDDDDVGAWSIEGVVDLRDGTDPQGPLVQVLTIAE
jgi:hypothetical protein